jgi:hypothetical protein
MASSAFGGAGVRSIGHLRSTDKGRGVRLLDRLFLLGWDDPCDIGDRKRQMAFAFDTLGYAKRLWDAGIPLEQA